MSTKSSLIDAGLSGTQPQAHEFPEGATEEQVRAMFESFGLHAYGVGNDHGCAIATAIMSAHKSFPDAVPDYAKNLTPDAATAALVVMDRLTARMVGDAVKVIGDKSAPMEARYTYLNVAANVMSIAVAFAHAINDMTEKSVDKQALTRFRDVQFSTATELGKLVIQLETELGTFKNTDPEAGGQPAEGSAQRVLN